MTVGEMVLLAAVAILAIALVLLMLRSARAMQGADGLTRLVDAQATLAGRLSQMADGQAAAQARMAEQLQVQERAVSRLLEQRLEDMTRRIGENLQKSSDKNTATMGQLQERLAVIDAAQKGLTDLSNEVVSLQDILSNKQARGIFGQGQMEDIIRDMMPAEYFSFEKTLSNGKRVDCLIKLPNPPGSVSVDSKYPHEAYLRLLSAKTDEERKAAGRDFRRDVTTHIRDIADKYIVPGETGDTALMFIPAESIYAELHQNFPEVVQEGLKRRVFLVSPGTLWMMLHTLRALIRDARIREHAVVLQAEIGKLMQDVGRLNDRVGKLGSHFGQVIEDVRQVQISADKIVGRGDKIAEIQFEPPGATEGLLERGAEQTPRLQ